MVSASFRTTEPVRRSSCEYFAANGRPFAQTRDTHPTAISAFWIVLQSTYFRPASAPCHHPAAARCRRASILLLLRATIYTSCSGERGVESASFVHIPKTGGTSIHRALLEAGCPALRVKENTNHLITASKATRGGRRCFLVLREPTDRFVSSYSYFISQSALRAT